MGHGYYIFTMENDVSIEFILQEIITSDNNHAAV